MRLNDETKKTIEEALRAHCDKFPSRNAAVERMEGVSAATVSNILNGKTENVSDEMWLRIARLTGLKFDGWQIHENKTYQEIRYVLADAQAYKNVTWVTGDAGCGKTTAAQMFRKENRNVLYILCSEDMRRTDFVRELARQTGVSCDQTSLRDILDRAIEEIAQMDNPLLIFDEGDKLTDSLMNYFISIYNRLEDHAGIVFLSTDFIKRRIDAGLRYNKKGFKEINSRIGRQFFEVKAATEADVWAICMANGLTEERDIRDVVADAAKAGNDLRRVKRMVHARKRLVEARKRRAEHGGA